MPVYYGDWSLYQPSVGSLRQCFETRCTVTIDSSVLLRVPFQANTSEFSEILLILGVIVTPDSPLFNPAHAKEETELILGPISDAHSKGYESKSLLVEIGKGSVVTITIPNLLIKESDNTTAFRIRGKNVNVKNHDYYDL